MKIFIKNKLRYILLTIPEKKNYITFKSQIHLKGRVMVI